MCGIFGFVVDRENGNSRLLNEWSDELFKLSESRGKEAAGIAIVLGGSIKVYKEPRSASFFLDSSNYRKLFSGLKGKGPKAVIGHSRLATNGLQILNSNNQPIEQKEGVIVHNGIIVNESDLWRYLKKNPKYQVDTEVILELIVNYCNKGYSLKDAVSYSFQKLEGSASIAFIHSRMSQLVLATNTGSLYILKLGKPNIVVFASEYFILETFRNRFFGKKGKVIQIPAGEGRIIGLESLEVGAFDLKKRNKEPKSPKSQKLFTIEDLSDPNYAPGPELLSLYSEKNSLKSLRGHDFDYQTIFRLRRCSRCILPETMPFIRFDEKGVCNYCLNYKPIRPRGRESLERLVYSIKKKHGQDVILAFSGGRDSAYGLHFLKRELGLNPIAYTYDWGMVTDLARRNQARMVGKLGVEHIVVSADITQKRKYIKNHITAWLKKPDLGMVPLFMQGDKQCVYYVDQLSKRLEIPLVVYCRGKELENEEFKWGHCGIKEGSPKGVIHNLSLKGKIQIAGYYGLRYLANPSYINSSMFDTLFSYFSTYVQKHNYIFLWHYIAWNEEKIVKTLERQYGWERDPETSTTWRIDDGSSAFYNYIYYSLQGFTENDTFRSNQIREGVLTRPEAFRLVQNENKPRYEALKWYFDRVGLEGDKVLSVIDGARRLY